MTCHTDIFSELAPGLGYYDRPSLLHSPPPLPSPHDHEKNKQTILKIPYKKPEEEFVMKYHKLLPTPIPKHNHQIKTLNAIEHFNKHQPTNVNPPPVAVGHHFHPELRQTRPMLVTVTPTPAPLHHEIGPSPPRALVPVPVTISPSLFVPHHSHHKAQRRYSIEDTQARPRRARPTTYNQMRLITPSPSPLSYNSYSTPLHLNLATTPAPPLTHSRPQPTTPNPLHIQKFSTPSSTKKMVKTAKKYLSQQLSNPQRLVLPPINNHPEPLLIHRAEPIMSYQQDTGNIYSSQDEIKEEPKYLVQLVPNPKYKQKLEEPIREIPTPREVEIIQVQNQSKEPNLYPYLYVLSSYLPETEHSLVVAKKS